MVQIAGTNDSLSFNRTTPGKAKIGHLIGRLHLAQTPVTWLICKNSNRPLENYLGGREVSKLLGITASFYCFQSTHIRNTCRNAEPETTLSYCDMQHGGYKYQELFQ